MKDHVCTPTELGFLDGSRSRPRPCGHPTATTTPPPGPSPLVAVLTTPSAAVAAGGITVEATTGSAPSETTHTAELFHPRRSSRSRKRPRVPSSVDEVTAATADWAAAAAGARCSSSGGGFSPHHGPLRMALGFLVPTDADGAAAAAGQGQQQQEQSQESQRLPGVSTLRCIADLERAITYLRSRDPRLVPLIEQHGLPVSLVANTPAAAPFVTSAAGATAASTVVASSATTITAASVATGFDPSLGCGKGRTSTNPSTANSTSSVQIPGDPGGGSGGAGESIQVRGGGASGGGGGPWDVSNAGGGRSVFAALSRSVVYQQLATSAAAAIWGRVLAVCKASSADHITPHQVLIAPPDQLRAAGLSGRKLEYLVGVAEAFPRREGWDEQLAASSDLEHLVSELTPLRGVGSWTVHMLAMFHLGLSDVLPVGDLGVRRGLQLLHGLRKLPGPAQVEALTEAWRPYRSVGSWYMWRILPPPRSFGGGTKKAATAATKVASPGATKKRAASSSAPEEEGGVDGGSDDDDAGAQRAAHGGGDG